ncbi:glycosyltransferase [Patescibacteria group bacterium]|nr:glycosyltransferase [Patescibacteria group bacterium]
MKVSLVVPTYTLNTHLQELALLAVASYRDFVDELIVCEDGGMFCPYFMQLADTYIYNKENAGFSVNVNRGWRFATGDFVMIANSDTQLMSGNLRDLCVPGKVTSPEISNQFIDRLAGPFWCAPKDVTAKRGYLMEEMRIYSSDSEYDERIKDIFQKVPSVKLFHEQAQTVSAAGVEGGEQQAIDRQIYAQLKQEGKAA